MVDIVIPSIHRINKYHKNNRKQKNIVLRGKIVSIRKARYRVNSLRPRKKDEPNSKAFIIIVKYNDKTEDLINRIVEIKII